MATYNGSPGNDTLVGSVGNIDDVLNGFLGNDLYRYTIGYGNDVITDTGGVDDDSALGDKRREKMFAALRRMDVAVLIVEPNVWTEHEERLLQELKSAGRPLLVVVGKTDLQKPSASFLERVRAASPFVVESTASAGQRDRVVNAFKAALGQLMPEGSLHLPDFFGGAVPPGGIVLLIIPVDMEAPKGRLILPQAQAVRAALDGSAIAVVATETEYLAALAKLAPLPDLVVCDSQVVDRMVAETPPNVRCTTFSILLARLKGDLPEMVKAARAIDDLQDGDRILIGEACTHHAMDDDIGRKKIPRWLKEKTGKTLQIDVMAGRDWPADLEKYRLVIHCGACMLNRREMLYRLQTAGGRGVPMTNYGVAISFLKGVLPRVLEPFPDGLAALNN
jgi:[FeFe] hydrogenase H-cluster maturation GTPase HydF